MPAAFIPPLLRRITPSILVFLCSFLSLAAHAQSFGRIEQTESNVHSYYKYFQPGAATVEVYVMGTVRSTGLYEVSAGTNLGKLLALAGGPSTSARESSNRSKVLIRLYRPQAENEDPLYEATLEHAITNPSAYPTLQDGDVLVVETTIKPKINWFHAVRALNASLIVLLTIDRLARAF